MKRLLTVLSIALALGLGACDRKAAPPAPEKVIRVAVQVVRPKPLVDHLMVRATIEPWQCVHLSAEVPGRVVFIGKDRGQAVQKGERLFGIDKSTFQAALASAKSGAEYAVLSHSRSEQLFAKKALSRDELDRALADKSAALAAVETAEAELGKTDILSPIDGVLDSRTAEVGEYVGPGAPLGDVVDTSRVKVIASVPEKDVIHVREGEAMQVVIDALGPVPREGRVIFVKQVADPKTLTFPVHVALENADGRIRPGMIARVELVRQSLAEAIAVPIFAVVTRAHGSEVSYHVFVEEGGVARERANRIGFFDGPRVQVTEGLEAGDRLIVEGQRDLVDGDEVVATEVPAGPAAGQAAGSPAGGGPAPADEAAWPAAPATAAPPAEASARSEAGGG
jgi:membrane fusion protein (multidrug efflux system)